MHRFALLVAFPLALVSRSLTAQATPATDRSPRKETELNLSLGSTLFSGSEGNYAGLSAQGGIAYVPRGSRLGARADLLIHRFGTRDLYPCILQEGGVCFERSQRTVTGFAIGLTFEPPRRTTAPTAAAPYLIGGVGVYGSRRDARHNVNCPSLGTCPSGDRRELMTDTDFGAHIGAGVRFTVSALDMMAEMRVHQPIWHAGPDRALRSYRLIPVSLGIRF